MKTGVLSTVQRETFEGENFCGLLAFAVPRDATLNFTEKTFANSLKTVRIHKSFLPRKFPTIRYKWASYNSYSMSGLDEVPFV